MQLFTVSGPSAQPILATTLASEGLAERAHLQEWVIAHPDVLGENLLVVTAEYDRWSSADGVTAKDRLDVLALEPSGRLVVVELKRDEDRDVHLQAITYAALVSRFTAESIAQAHAEFRSHRGQPTTAEQARDLLDAHLIDEWDAELLRRPRIVLVAGRFSRTVTHCAVWLSEIGLDLTLVEVSAWRLPDGQISVGFEQLYPTAAVEEFTLAPARQEGRAATARAAERSRAASAVSRIVKAGLLRDDQALTLTPTTYASPTERAAIESWVQEDPSRGHAIWRNDPIAPIVWQADGLPWRPTTLARHILKAAGLPDRAVRGPQWWLVDGTDTDLAALADGLQGTTAFDWSPLHTILDAVPPGRWTTYGDLAAAVGTAPQPLGAHIVRCDRCENGYRVLGVNGRMPGGFRWSDPDRTDDPIELLRTEGVRFMAGRADETQRLTAEDLGRLLTTS